MREILFRGKAINRNKNRSYRTNYKNGDWVYGLLTRHKDKWFCAEMTNTDGVSGIDIEEETLGQFTGKKDKFGKKIFEGDIVEGKISSAWATQTIRCVVKYINDGFYTEEHHDSGRLYVHKLMFSKNIEVIGNIYDNPDLLSN